MVHRRSHLSSLSFRIRVCHPNTRIYVRLLGPCFKTGHLKPFHQHPKRWCGEPTVFPTLANSQRAVYWEASRSDWVPKNAADLSLLQGRTRDYNTRRWATFLKLFTPEETDVDLPTSKCTALRVRLITCRQYWFQTFPFWQFHVLFNSLFKVLFIFPSRYLFAIGLSPIFSFRWYLPPILVCIPKQTDSWKTYHMNEGFGPKTGFSPSMMPRSKGLMPNLHPKTFL